MLLPWIKNVTRAPSCFCFFDAFHWRTFIVADILHVSAPACVLISAGLIRCGAVVVTTVSTCLPCFLCVFCLIPLVRGCSHHCCYTVDLAPLLAVAAVWTRLFVWLWSFLTRSAKFGTDSCLHIVKSMLFTPFCQVSFWTLLHLLRVPFSPKVEMTLGLRCLLLGTAIWLFQRGLVRGYRF